MNNKEIRKEIKKAIKELKRWQMGVLAAVVVGSFAITYGVFAITGGSGGQDLEENQRLIPVRFGNLENEVAINGSITFSNKETMNFGASGIVSEILVEEGQEVEAGTTIGQVHSIDRPEQAPRVYTARRTGTVICRHHPGLIQRGDALAVIAEDYRPG